MKEGPIPHFLVIPFMVHLVNVHPATGEIIVWSHKEGSMRAIVTYDSGFGGEVGIISDELDFVVGLLRVKDHERMVDR